MECNQLLELKKSIEDQEEIISNNIVINFFNIGLQYVHSQVEYIKLNGKDSDKWSVTTWSRNINYRIIEYNGTEEDIARLGPARDRNKRHSRKRKRNS